MHLVYASGSKYSGSVVKVPWRLGGAGRSLNQKDFCCSGRSFMDREVKALRFLAGDTTVFIEMEKSVKGQFPQSGSTSIQIENNDAQTFRNGCVSSFCQGGRLVSSA